VVAVVGIGITRPEEPVAACAKWVERHMGRHGPERERQRQCAVREAGERPSCLSAMPWRCALVSAAPLCLPTSNVI